MNVTSIPEDNWFKDIQYGNKGAVLFIIAYIGFYGLCIICLFGQQLKDTQRQRSELPAHFLKTLWDVPNKTKLYQELADAEHLKQIFRCYFVDHETYSTMRPDELQAMVDKRAHACALKYQQKLQGLHLTHTDYNLDRIQRLANQSQEQSPKSITSTRIRIKNIIIDDSNQEENENRVLSISVV